MGYVSSDIKAVSSASKSGIWWQEEALPANDNCGGKYKSISRYSGKAYAKVWYNGNNFYPEYTYTDAYMRKNGIGKYANANANANAGGAQGGGASAKPLTFGQKLTRVAVAMVADSAMEVSRQKKASALTRTKRALPKPKPTRVATASTSVAGAATTGVKKSLLSTTKVASIAKARPTAAASRGNVLGMVKSSGSKAKGSSIFGKSKPLSKKGGIAGGGIKKAGGSTLGGGVKKSGGMLGGGAKKSGGMLGGGAKKSGGMLGGGAKKSGGMLGGGAKKLGGGMLGGKKRR